MTLKVGESWVRHKNRKDDAKWLAYARIRQVRRARPSITTDADSQLWRHRDSERNK